jgi:CBS domain-containing protein
METQMTDMPEKACLPVDISDNDIYEAMKEIPGYLDITPGDFKEVYLKAFQHAVRRLTRAIHVSKIMTKDVARATRDTPLWEVAELMAQRKISGLPVVDADERVVGVISNRDFVAALGGDKSGTLMQIIAECLKGSGCLAVQARSQRAEDLMTSPPVTASPETSVMDAAYIMARRGINRIPIVDGTGRLVGIVSRADIVRASIVG